MPFDLTDSNEEKLTYEDEFLASLTFLIEPDRLRKAVPKFMCYNLKCDCLAWAPPSLVDNVKKATEQKAVGLKKKKEWIDIPLQ